MRLLLDTHVLLWWLADDGRLDDRRREAIADPRNMPVFSAVSIAEIAITVSLGTLDADDDVTRASLDQGFEPLPLSPAHASRLRELPWHHRDPFDRLLIAQAQAEGLVLVTADRRLALYDVSVL